MYSQATVNLRDPHSFPTRRSSDLAVCPSQTPIPISNPRRLGPSGSRMRSAATKDRKSTRLNSSHLVISYAVFCLKKKKITHHTHLLYFDTPLHIYLLYVMANYLTA